MAQQKKVMISIGTVLFLMILVLPMIMAAGTQQYNKIFLNPFYRESFTSATNYTYNITINPPDKISSVSSAILSWNAQINGQTQSFSIWVNGQQCNTKNYTVATAFSTTGNVQFYFDCTNIIKKAGIYNITMRSTVNTGAMIGWLDLTYMSNPSGITIHGTEYATGNPGKVWLQLLDSAKTPIDNATCFMTMYTPNNLQLYSYLQMTYLDNGIHYFDFFAPEAVGVYPVVADCYYITDAKMSYANNYSIAVGSVISGDAASLSSNDGNRLKLSEQNVEGPGLDFNMTIKNVTDISLETDIVFGLHGRWAGRDIDPVYIKIWNYTSSSWINMPNVIPNTGGMDVDTTNVIIIPSGSNATAMGIIKNGNVTIRFVDANVTDEAEDLEQLQIDSIWINVIAQGSTGTWEQVKGSSEVHVNSNGGHLYSWNTLCDDHNPSCALFSSSSELTEGTINETLTINNIYRASLQDTIEYDTALGLDCTGVLSVIETYDDGTILDVTDITIYDIGNQQNCNMHIPVSFESTQKNMDIKIVFDNYPKWEVEWAKDVVDSMSPTITDYCNEIATQENITYNLPINTSLIGAGLSPDAQYCYRAMDDLWYFDSNYELSQSINTIGEYLSYLSESRFYYPLVYNHYNKIKQTLNSVTGTLKVFGTDYQVNDTGRTFVQILDSSNLPANNATCTATVYYPNNTMFFNRASMTYVSGSEGLYYLDFVAPSTVGIYMISVICNLNQFTNRNNATSYILGSGWYYGGSGSSLTLIDTNWLNISERNYNPGYYNTTVTTSLMAHMDEANNSLVIYDSSNNPVNGTNFNSPILGAPSISGAGQAYYYDGVNQYSQFPANSKFNLNSTDHLMICLIFNDSVAGNVNGARLVSAETTDTLRVSYDGGNAIRLITSRSGTGAKTLDTPLAYNDGQWHTYCGYSNFTAMTAFIDGVQVITAANVQSGTMTFSNGIFLGQKDGGGNPAATGLDEVCLMKGTFGSGQSAAALALAYNTTKQCGSPQGQLDMNITIPNITAQSDTLYFNIITTYQWSGNPETIQMYLRNYTGNSWYRLSGNLTYATTDNTITSQITIATATISQFLSGGTMIIRLNDSDPNGAVDMLKINQIRVDQVRNSNAPVDAIRGGGELNIRNYSFDLIPKIPQNVWNYPTRNLTYIDYNSIAQNVWNFSTRNLTYYQDVTNYSLIAQMVWNYISRNLTSTPDMTNYFTIQEMVWNATNRNLTYYNMTDTTNYTLAAQTVWTYVTRNLTFTPDQTNYSQIQIYVWNATTRNLTYYQPTNLSDVPASIWNFTSRNLTYTPDMTNYSQIFIGVWNYTTRALTYYDLGNNLAASDVWNYISRNLTFIPPAVVDYPTMQQYVWNYTSRNLTYYNMTDVTDYNLIAQVVWNFSARNLTYYNLGNNLSANDVWNYVSRNLTFYQDVTNYTLASQNMWSYNNRTLTYYQVNNISVTDIWSYLNRSLTENISQEVWMFQSRNLTYTPDMTNYTLGAQTIWQYVNRSLTQDLPFEVWTYNNRTTTNNQNISLDVWTYYNRSLTFYPDVTDYSLIWNYPSRNLTYYSDMTNYTLIPLNVWSYNGVISNNILNQIAASIWGYTGSITIINSQIIQGVWSAPARYTHGTIID